MPPPDRWEIYSQVGNPIPGTRMICCKVPLKKILCRDMDENQQFTPETLKTLITEKGFDLKLVIDLTYTTKYYAPHEFTRQGVHHEKIFTEGHVVPSDDVVYRLFDVLEKFKEDNSDEKTVAAIHCTHGVNRTGYLVCRYMIERLGFEPQEAIRAYGEARGHQIERVNYLQDLHTRSLNMEYKYEGREKLPMVKKEWNKSRNSLQGDDAGKYQEGSDRRSGRGYSRTNSENRSWKRTDYSQAKENGESSRHCDQNEWSSTDEGYRRRNNEQGHNRGHNSHSNYHNSYSSRSVYNRDKQWNGENFHQDMYRNSSYRQGASQYPSHQGRVWHRGYHGNRGYHGDRGRNRYQGRGSYQYGYHTNQASGSSPQNFRNCSSNQYGYYTNQASGSSPQNFGNSFYGGQEHNRHKYTKSEGSSRYQNHAVRTRSRSPHRGRK